MRLNQRARPPGTPAAGVVVVVATVRPMPLMAGNIASRPRPVKTGAPREPQPRLTLGDDRDRLVLADPIDVREQQLFVNLDRARAHDLARIGRRDLGPGAPAKGRALVLIER